MEAVLGPGGPSIATLFATDGPGDPFWGDHLWHGHYTEPCSAPYAYVGPYAYGTSHTRILIWDAHAYAYGTTSCPI